GVRLLTDKPLDFGKRHAFDADFTERVLHFHQFEWFDNGFDFLPRLWLLGSLTDRQQASVGFGDTTLHRSAGSGLRPVGRWLENRKRRRQRGRLRRLPPTI